MPKIYYFEQGSEEWKIFRIGIPTASEFFRIVTPTGKLSSQARAYAIRLIAEKLFGYPMEDLGGIPAIARGKELEASAVRMYEYEYDAETKPVGFITTDDGEIGCSPDRLVGTDGLMEIKCCYPHIHLGYRIDGLEKDYIGQIQGQLWVSERKWCDFYSFHDQAPPVKIRVERNEEYIGVLAASIREFVKMKNELLEKIKADGFFEERQRMLEILDPHNYESVMSG